MTKKIYRPYNKTNVTFFIVYPLITAVGIIWLFAHGGPHWGTWVLTFVMLYASGLGITAGYHRLYSHRSYDAIGPVRLILMLLGGAALQGSVKEWSSDHRTHHRYVDTEKDPYSITEGFWHAHIGWILKELVPSRDLSNIKDIEADPLVRFQHRYYMITFITVSILLPTIIASFWGDPWGGFFLAGWGRVFFNHQATFSINSFCHLLGTQPYSTTHSARDSWITALFTYGEGYHNFHHEFPGDYRNGLKTYHWDPGKWLIDFMALFGWAKNLRLAQPELIFQCRLKAEQDRIVLKLSREEGFVKTHVEALLQNTRIRVEEAHLRFLKLRNEYYRLKKEKMNSMQTQIEKLKQDLLKARQNFESAFKEWQFLVRQPAPASI